MLLNEEQHNFARVFHINVKKALFALDDEQNRVDGRRTSVCQLLVCCEFLSRIFDDLSM